ncbi:hypothetical protein XHV734_1271 [Xanthomonas hortorum pv. vitians]|nr:hypothetical protein XHV734_1271 [Xanthomonas hortorum pv. vitians]
MRRALAAHPFSNREKVPEGRMRVRLHVRVENLQLYEVPFPNPESSLSRSSQ